MKHHLQLLLAGVLVIEGGGAIAGANAAELLRDKTLVAWVVPANLTQRGGSVLTIEKPGGVFDGIVLGEIAPAKWMPGSVGSCGRGSSTARVSRCAPITGGPAR
jgi:hypothetical protein